MTLAQAHAAMGEVDGPGRPLELGRPVGHAYILRVVAEFQAFVRDLHDLAAERVVDLAKPDARYRPLLVAAVTEGRFIDRDNADVRSLEQDFRRLGINGRLRARGVADTVTWARSRLPGLDRTARALDRLVWDHVVEMFKTEPW